MKVTEFRIGNLINNDNQIISIDNLSSGRVTCSGNSFSGMVSFEEHEIKPIKIIEERMTALGFELASEGYFKKNDYRFRLSNGILYVSVGEDKDGMLLTTIKYVHELQNLCFALHIEILNKK